MQTKEQWPKSYLNSWSAFSDDEKSVKYAFELFKFSTQDRLAVSSLKVADIMCGSGKFGKAFMSKMAEFKLDASITYIHQSTEILSSISLEKNEKTIQADVINMSHIPSESFDVIVCRYGYNNLPKEAWETTLNETLRILKPGGVFLLQDHFIPGSVFSELVNEAEQYLAKMEHKSNKPFIYSTESFNSVLDANHLIKSRIKVGYGFFVNIWDRLKSKKEILPDFDLAKAQILDFYKKICLEKYKLLIVDAEEYIHVFNVTYAIVKK
jgi:ubiquinone/menaquinone biosynthesis C-methylase UbiE